MIHYYGSMPAPVAIDLAIPRENGPQCRTLTRSLSPVGAGHPPASDDGLGRREYP